MESPNIPQNESRERLKRQRIDYARAATEACRELLGKKPVQVDAPGGGGRKSLKVDFADGSAVIVTRRHHRLRASIEAGVLRALGDAGVPVPQLLAFDGTWILQEYIAGKRLSERLAEVDEATGAVLLERAVEGLRLGQEAGHAAGIDAKLPVLGQDERWRREFAETPLRLSAFLRLPPPRLSLDEIVAALAVARPYFVKWDARPGNAIVCQDDSLVWFDWEHCGSRNRLDDLLWLLGDDFTPDWPDSESRLLGARLDGFSGGGAAVDGLDYVMLFGSIHSAVRLALIFDHKKGGPWWDLEACLALDRVGVTRELALRHCRRGARWAARNPLTEPLVGWFGAIGAHAESLA